MVIARLLTHFQSTALIQGTWASPLLKKGLNTKATCRALWWPTLGQFSLIKPLLTTCDVPGIARNQSNPLLSWHYDPELRQTLINIHIHKYKCVTMTGSIHGPTWAMRANNRGIWLWASEMGNDSWSHLKSLSYQGHSYSLGSLGANRKKVPHLPGALVWWATCRSTQWL